jgi:prepilin-type N-terminal cleavage/methylation domain-containing protein
LKIENWKLAIDHAGRNPHAQEHSSMKSPHVSSRRCRRGFTLVELLIVIVIIGLLVGLVSVAAVSAMKTARNAKITLEINDMSRALQEYKDKYGAFPPCHNYDVVGGGAGSVEEAARNRIQRHVAQAFPRYRRDADGDGDYADYDDIRTDILTATTDLAGTFTSGRDINNLDPAEALVFWLGGLPARFADATGDATTSGTQLIGFAQDPANPFQHEDATTGQPQRTTPYPFDTAELTDNDADGWYEYTPESVMLVAATPAPYVYFDSASYKGWYQPNGAGNNPAGGSGKAPPTGVTSVPLYGYPSTTLTNHGLSGNAALWGVAWPMWEDGGNNDAYPEWEQPNGFQIICCGLDGAYTGAGGDAELGPATFPEIPGDTGATPDYQPMLDNLTSFTEGTLESEREKHDD